MNGGDKGGDERLWKPEMDKSGNGYGCNSFLPAPDGEDLPWVKLFTPSKVPVVGILRIL